MADGPIQRLWDSMQEYAWNQGRVIKQAPASFALAVLLACIPIGFVMWRGIDALYNERIAVLQATIQQLNALTKSRGHPISSDATAVQRSILIP